MKCPECGVWSTVLETRTTENGYRRRRQCANEHKFTTEEVVVQKSSGVLSTSKRSYQNEDNSEE